MARTNRLKSICLTVISELKESYIFFMHNADKPYLRSNVIRCFLVYAILFVIQGLPFFPENAILSFGIVLGIYALILAAVFGYLGLINAVLFNSLGALLVIFNRMNRLETPGYGENHVYFHIFSFLFFIVVGAAIIAVLSERGRKKQQKLEWLSIVDGLTEAYNHRYFQQRLDEEIARARRSGASLAMLMIDIDDFKVYNDTFGHRTGDRALKRCSDYFKASLRNNEVVFRYGGDEFAVIMPDTDIEQACIAATRLKDNFTLGGIELENPGSPMLGISIGFSAYPEPATGRDELIVHADNSLYQSKCPGIQQNPNLSETYQDTEFI